MIGKSMKRGLFVLALLSIIFGCQAEYSEYYKVYYQGRELQNGETVICDNAYDHALSNRVVKMYNAIFNVVNQQPIPSLNRATIGFIDNPTQEEWDTNTTEWGLPKLCYTGGDENGEMASCMGISGIVKIPDNTYDCFNWEFQLQKAPVGLVSSYSFTLKAAEGELQWERYEYIPDSEFEVTVIFKTEEAHVDSPTANDAEAQYFTIDGRKIDNPGKGLYIERKGSEFKKVFK